MTCSRINAKALLPLSAAFILSLSACSQAEEENETYVAGVEDAGGGDLIVSEPDPNAVPVDVPETPMTPVPSGSESPSPAPSPAETPE